ncbi:MAG: AIR synthase-related protein, partial [Dictyoglomus turgidum]
TEACRNILCVGGRPLAITDGLNFGDPDEAEVFYQFRETIKGIDLASRALEIPIVSGNVSFYNGQAENTIFPTPIIGMVGILEDLSYLIKPGFKVVGNPVYLIGDFSWLSLGGSKFIKDIFGKIEGEPPYVDLIWERKLKFFMEEIRKERDIVLSAHDISEGGLLSTLLEMSFWGEKGVEIVLPSDKIENLIGEGSGLIVVEINKDKEIKYLDFIEKYGLKTQKIGIVKEKEFIVEPFIKRNINEFLRRR